VAAQHVQLASAGCHCVNNGGRIQLARWRDPRTSFIFFLVPLALRLARPNHDIKL